MKLKVSVSILFLTILVYGCGQQHSKNSPKVVGHIAVLDSLIQQEIEADNIPGAVIQVKKGDSILHRAAYGYAERYSYDLEPLDSLKAMTTEHLFDLASLTKVCATTFGIMKLVDEGKLSVDDPIHKYFPEFNEGAKSNITVRHLLTHTSGLPQWVPTYYYASNRQQRFEYVAGLSLKWEVGQGRHYSDLGFMLLGDIIEQVSGQRLDAYLQDHIYGPLGLKKTTYNPLQKSYEQIAATSHGNPFEKRMVYDDAFGYNVEVDPQSWDGWRQYTLKGEVNDGNAWYANGGIAGHAGLFSTVGDLQVLVDLLLQKGTYGGKQLIAPQVIDTFLTKGKYGNGLGWAMENDIIAAKGSPKGTFGHTGFTGTNIIAVPQDSLSIILLTNRQHVGPQENGYYFDLDQLRQKIFDAVVETPK